MTLTLIRCGVYETATTLDAEAHDLIGQTLAKAQHDAPVDLGEARHPSWFIDLLLEVAQSTQSPQDFIKRYTSKNPVFTATKQGIAALRFEHHIAQGFETSRARFVETALDDKTFLAIFEGSLTTTELDTLNHEVQDIAVLEREVNAGDVNYTEQSVSDLTILRGKPVANKATSKDPAPKQAQVFESLKPQTEADYENARDGVPTNLIARVLNKDLSEAYPSGGKLRLLDENGIIWTEDDGRWFPSNRIELDESKIPPQFLPEKGKKKSKKKKTYESDDETGAIRNGNWSVFEAPVQQGPSSATRTVIELRTDDGTEAYAVDEDFAVVKAAVASMDEADVHDYLGRIAKKGTEVALPASTLRYEESQSQRNDNDENGEGGTPNNHGGSQHHEQGGSGGLGEGSTKQLFKATPRSVPVTKLSYDNVDYDEPTVSVEVETGDVKPLRSALKKLGAHTVQTLTGGKEIMAQFDSMEKAIAAAKSIARSVHEIDPDDGMVYVQESVTPGMKNAYAKMGERECPHCGFKLPKYPGRYPKNCPECEKPLGESFDTESNSDELDTVSNLGEAGLARGATRPGQVTATKVDVGEYAVGGNLTGANQTGFTHWWTGSAWTPKGSGKTKYYDSMADARTAAKEAKKNMGKIEEGNLDEARALPTENEGYGMHGEIWSWTQPMIDASYKNESAMLKVRKELWDIVSKFLADGNVTVPKVSVNWNPEVVRAFLDSRSGRYFADAVYDNLLGQNRKLQQAHNNEDIEGQAAFWLGRWKPRIRAAMLAAAKKPNMFTSAKWMKGFLEELGPMAEHAAKFHDDGSEDLDEVKGYTTFEFSDVLKGDLRTIKAIVAANTEGAAVRDAGDGDYYVVVPNRHKNILGSALHKAGIRDFTTMTEGVDEGSVGVYNTKTKTLTSVSTSGAKGIRLAKLTIKDQPIPDQKHLQVWVDGKPFLEGDDRLGK